MVASPHRHPHHCLTYLSIFFIYIVMIKTIVVIVADLSVICSIYHRKDNGIKSSSDGQKKRQDNHKQEETMPVYG